MIIKKGDFNDPQVLNLIRIHLQGMHDNSPAEFVYALDTSSLQKPNISFFTIWEQNQLLACGAISEISNEHAELKSMRTHPDFLNQGHATRILKHLLLVAKKRGYRKVSLETGTTTDFEPAIYLYQKYGFKTGEAFSDYVPNEFSQYFHLELT